MERKQKGGFVKGGFDECALVPVLGSRTSKIIAFFCQGSNAGKGFLEEISYRGTSAKTTPMETALSCEPRYL